MEQTKQRERRITKCFTYIFIAFLVCFTPWALITTFDPMPPSSKGWLHMASYILSWSSVVVNPVIYCVTNRHYQVVLQKVPSEANPKVRNHGEGPY